MAGRGKLGKGIYIKKLSQNPKVKDGTLQYGKDWIEIDAVLTEDDGQEIWITVKNKKKESLDKHLKSLQKKCQSLYREEKHNQCHLIFTISSECTYPDIVLDIIEYLEIPFSKMFKLEIDGENEPVLHTTAGKIHKKFEYENIYINNNEYRPPVSDEAASSSSSDDDGPLLSDMLMDRRRKRLAEKERLVEELLEKRRLELKKLMADNREIVEKKQQIAELQAEISRLESIILERRTTISTHEGEINKLRSAIARMNSTEPARKRPKTSASRLIL